MSEHCTIEVGGSGCAFLSGPLSFESVPRIYREAEQLFRANPGLTSIDLSKVTTADSAGLTLLLEWNAIQRKASKKLDIRNAPPELISLARLCEADDVMTLSGRDQQS